MKKAFSLIELIVVIAIIAVLLAVALPNLLSTRERARDAKRKQEMNELKNALRMYYNDFQTYPEADAFGGGVGKLNYIVGCGPGAVSVRCPCVSGTVTVDFATGATCEIVYMKKFPSEFGSSMYYYYSSSGNDFCLKVPLENAADGDITTSKSRCSAACGTNCTGTKDYCVCAD